jgi:hypothetical protein
MTDGKHENYEVLNLIGYGLAKFGRDFVAKFGFKTKTAFFEDLVSRGVGETVGTIKNRQDLFDPFFANGRKGWWQKGDAYIHRKKQIDLLFGTYDAEEFSKLIQVYFEKHFKKDGDSISEISPIIKSKFKKLQLTGREAELYFMENFNDIDVFRDGVLEDARAFGDGYDFQVQVGSKFLLAEIKGVRAARGKIRMTEREFTCAEDYKTEYGLVIVSNLETVPKMTTILAPTQNLVLEKILTNQPQVTYHSTTHTW